MWSQQTTGEMMVNISRTHSATLCAHLLSQIQSSKPPPEMLKPSVLSFLLFNGFHANSTACFHAPPWHLGQDGGEVRFFPGGHLAWGDGWAGTAWNPPGQEEKRRQLLYVPMSASFPKRRSASETKLLIRSHSASCCHLNFHPTKPSALGPTSSPFSSKCKCPQGLSGWWAFNWPVATGLHEV